MTIAIKWIYIIAIIFSFSTAIMLFWEGGRKKQMAMSILLMGISGIITVIMQMMTLTSYLAMFLAIILMIHYIITVEWPKLKQIKTHK